MRELERRSSPPSALHRVAVLGAGRLGPVLAAALRAGGLTVFGPLGRSEPVPRDVDAVLLCVGDREIAAAAATVPPGPLVGHCSGASSLAPLGRRPAFSLHPLMSVTAGADPAVLRGAAAAVDGSTPQALAAARTLALAAGLSPLPVAAGDRVAYHAAASIAANYLVTLEAAAERLAASAGLDRAQLVPLVRATVENWAALGPARALTGPVARGDEATVAAQRAAVAQRAPELLELFDAMRDATRRLAAGPAADPPRPQAAPC